MASKMKLRKLLLEKRGLAELTRPRPTDLAVMRLRLPGPKAAPPKAPRLITVAMRDHPDIPQPVQIMHRAASAQPRPTVP
jgi:hypothetical protein